MALQVWLPLNGTWDNHGCSSLSPYSPTIPFTLSGNKIGNNPLFSSESFSMVVPELNGLTQFSISLWYKLVSGQTFTQFSDVISISDSLNSLRLETNNTSGTGTQWYGFGMNNSGSVGKTITLDTWYHDTLVVNGTSIKRYVNGTYLGEVTATSAASLTTTLKLGDTKMYCQIADLRIYDHCLSPKEVKEISKCLVMHYPLDANGLGMPNLVDNSNTFNGWSAASGWTKGISDDGSAMYSFSRTGATSNNWVRLIPTLQINGNNYPNGITVSMDLLTPDKSAINSKRMGSLQTYQSNGSRIGWVEPEWNLNNVVNNQWSRISYTFNQTQLLNNNTSGTIYAYTMFSFQLVQNGNISIRKIMITEGNKDQPYTLSLNDIGTTEIDTSGFKYNGTRSNVYANSDTQRYSCSSKFDGSVSYIQIPFNSAISTGENFTINLWFKKSELGSKGYETLIGGPSGFEMDTRQGTETTLSLYMSTHGGKVFTPFEFNTWYMVTMVNDGTNEMYYVNGELKKTITKVSMPSGNYFIGAWRDISSQNYKGLISDVRIYATPLSVSDILELYNTGASIDNGGNVLTYDIQEK